MFLLYRENEEISDVVAPGDIISFVFSFPKYWVQLQSVLHVRTMYSHVCMHMYVCTCVCMHIALGLFPVTHSPDLMRDQG